MSLRDNNLLKIFIIFLISLSSHFLVGEVEGEFETSELASGEESEEFYENISWYSLKTNRKEKFIESLGLDLEELAFIESEPIIKVGLRLYKEPFSLVDNSRYKGYFKDLLEDLFEGTGVKIAYIPFKVSQASVLTRLKNDVIDIGTAIFNLKDDQFKTGGTLNFKADVVVFNKNRGGLTKASFEKLNLVVSRSNNMLNALRQYPSGEHPRFVPMDRNVFERVSTNGSEYTVTHMPHFKYFKERYGVGGKLSYVKVSDLSPDLPVIERRASYAYKASGVLSRVIEKLQKKQSPQSIMAIQKKWLENYKYGLNNPVVNLSLTIDDLRFINSLKEVSVCMSRRNYPFEFFRNNEWVGFNVDLLKMFEESVGLKINILDTTTLKEQKALFEAKKVDFLMLTSDMKLRHDSLRSKNFFNYQYNYVTRYDSEYIKSMDQLLGKKVGLRTGWGLDVIEKYKSIKFETSYSFKDILNNVSSGTYDAAIVPTWSLSRSIFMDGVHNLNVNGKASEFDRVNQTTLNYYTQPDMPLLNVVINKFLTEVSKRQLEELVIKWFGDYNSINVDSKLSKSGDKKSAYQVRGFPNLPGLSNNELRYLYDLNELRCGISPSFMPFGTSDKKKQEGLVVDMLKEMSKSLNKDIQFVHANSREQAYQLLKENRIDFYCLGMEDHLKMTEVNFSEPIGVYNLGVAVRDGFGEVTLDKLKGHAIGVLNGQPYTQLLKEQYPDFKFVHMPSVVEGMKRVQTKAIKGYIDLDPILNFHIRRKSVPSIVYGLKLPVEQSVNFVTNKNVDPHLLSVLNKAIKLFPDTERRLLSDKWYSVKVEKVTDYTTLYMMLGFTAILTMVFIYWNGKLARLNQIIKEKESLSRSLLESTNAVPYNYDLSKQSYTYVAPQITKVTGYLPSEFDHIEDWALRVHPDDREKVFEKRNQAVEKGEDFVLEYRFKRKNDVYIWVKDLVSVVVERQHTIALRGLIINITNEKNQAIAIKAAKEAAESANHSKSQFLANMSHEIRTPLNPIIGLTHLALKANPSEQIKDYLNKIELSSKSLLRIINDILDFSKMEANKLNLEKVPFDIEQLNERIKSLYGVKAAEKSIDLIFKKEGKVYPYVLGDPLRLEQVLGNLVSNAIKFTEQGHVMVSVECLGETDTTETLCFMVKDTGVGIPKNKLKKVFELFTQADDSNTRTHGGTGLGLNICTRLVEMMGGKLEATSEEGLGSKFYFSIPFNRVTQEQVEEQADPALNKNSIPKFERRKVLLVEDNKINKQVAEELLKAVNLDVTHVNNGLECINAVSNEDFDVVLMDIQMPVMDGFEATRRLRKDPRFERLPIVAMTAHAFASEKEQSKKVGMSSHVTKPVDPMTLYNTLRKYIPVLEILNEAPVKENGKLSYSQERLLNTTAGINRLMGNQDLYYNILIEFKNTYIDLLSQLEEKLVSKDKTEVQRVLHQLKGAAGNVGAELLFEAAQQFESVLKEEKDFHEEYEVFKEILIQTFASIDDEMEVFQKGSMDEPVKEDLSAEVEPVLEILLQQVRHASPDSLTTVDELAKVLGQGRSDEVMAIKIALQNFDFRKAAEKVAELQNTISTEVS